MKYSIAVVVLVQVVALSFGCGGDDNDGSSSGNGGTSSGNGGAGGSKASGGASNNQAGGKSSGGSTAAGVGGRTSGVGGFGAAGLPIDINCITGRNCTAGCSAACPNASSSSYSCTCTSGRLNCDLAACTASGGTTCATGTMTGSQCDGGKDVSCTLDAGSLVGVCVCNPTTDLWTCM